VSLLALAQSGAGGDSLVDQAINAASVAWLALAACLRSSLTSAVLPTDAGWRAGPTSPPIATGTTTTRRRTTDD
jgi:hypothetical protein